MLQWDGNKMEVEDTDGQHIRLIKNSKNDKIRGQYPGQEKPEFVTKEKYVQDNFSFKRWKLKETSIPSQKSEDSVVKSPDVVSSTEQGMLF
jgi:hypothetical protein